MSRAPRLRPAELDPSQRKLYDAITGGPRSAGPQAFPLTDGEGRLSGPFDLMLLCPPLGLAWQAVGAAVRYGGSLTARERELSIVAVAGACGSAFELYAHRAVGATVGLSDLELAAAEAGDPGPFGADREKTVVATVAALARDHDLDDAAYAAARELLGRDVLYELTTLVGYYSALALQLRVFRVGVPADEA